MASYYFLLFVLVAAFALSEVNCNELCTDFYCDSCPKLLFIVNQGVIKAIHNEARIGASLLRLHFHDCFVNLGGPSWEVGLGRRDSITASRADANKSIPAPFLNLDKLKASFANQGLSEKDLVALSGTNNIITTINGNSFELTSLITGAHTIGLARCSQFRAHIYNDSNIDPSFAKSLQSKCPRTGNDDIHQPFDFQTPTHFDNLYYKHLLAKKGLVHSDQELFNGNPTTDKLVQKYANDNEEFFEDFAEGMVKMSNLNPLTGSKGQIRINCKKKN
ncbi:hypothetical protein RYX36_015634 [Vicia faba]